MTHTEMHLLGVKTYIATLYNQSPDYYGSGDTPEAALLQLEKIDPMCGKFTYKPADMTIYNQNSLHSHIPVGVIKGIQ